MPIFYFAIPATGLQVMEQPGGRKFEIRYIPRCTPRDRNYEILREIERSAA